MRVVIVGAGIAGLTLALCLRRAGHEPLLVERSAVLRDDGYMIDFFGSGYDVAEQLGLLPALEEIHYPVARFTFLDDHGRERVSVSYAAFRRLFHGRHFNFMRGELERLIHARVQHTVPIRWGTTVVAVHQEARTVSVTLSDGSEPAFDLLVGADGVHSHVRALVFGPETTFGRFVGYATAAYILREPLIGLDRTDTVYTLSAPGRQVGVYPIGGGRLATFFVHRAPRPPADTSFEAAAADLRAEYAGLGWVVPELLERCDRDTIYFDAVTQIELPRWIRGRVTLVGDACQCVSLLAGQGASLAMAGAYLLARELEQPHDLERALARYQARLQPAIREKQEAGRRIARWFVPQSRFAMRLRDAVTRLAEWPVAWRLLRRSLAPESVLRA